MSLVNNIKARLIDTPNGDLKVVNAARVSFAKENKTLSDGDEGLIRYLATHKHWTPFSHCRETFAFKIKTAEDELSLLRFFALKMTQEDMASGVLAQRENVLYVRHSLYGWANILNRYEQNPTELSIDDVVNIYQRLCVKYPLSARYLINDKTHEVFCGFVIRHAEPEPFVDDPHFMDVTMCETVPIFVARQRFKHMVGTTYNEVSRRYVSTTPDVYVPDVWRGKHENKKQGSTDDPSDYMHDDANRGMIIAADIQRVIDQYDAMIANGVCPEQARLTVPQGMMTEYYVTANVSAWDRFIEQRKDSHAQKEIRDLAHLSEQILIDII